MLYGTPDRSLTSSNSQKYMKNITAEFVNKTIGVKSITLLRA